jgi:NADPH:quinone reductase-like Zn-dependent oxidoreductase
MKALYFEQFGLAEKVLKIGEFPRPKIIKNHSVVKILLSVVNPADFMYIAGKYDRPVIFPQIAGMDAVGLIEETQGTIPAGSLVAFRHVGTWTEYATVPDEQLIKLPDEYPLHKGVQLFLNAGTAKGLLDKIALKPQSWLLLTAGTSAIAKIILQMAIRKNLKIISITQKEIEVPKLKEMGAWKVIDLSSLKRSLKDEIMAATNGEGISGCLDCVGGNASSEILKSMQIGGHMIFYGVFDRSPILISSDLILFKELTIDNFRINRFLASITDIKKFYQELAMEIGNENFKIDIAAEFSITDFSKALTSAITEASLGKTLFRIANH